MPLNCCSVPTPDDADADADEDEDETKPAATMSVQELLRTHDIRKILHRVYPAGDDAASHAERHFKQGDHWYFRGMPIYNFERKGNPPPFHVILRTALFSMCQTKLLTIADADKIPDPAPTPLYGRCKRTFQEAIDAVEEGGDRADECILDIASANLKLLTFCPRWLRLIKTLIFQRMYQKVEET